MIDLILSIRDHLDHLQDRFRSFHNHGVQLEGWFKGELINLLDKLKIEGVVKDFDREVKLGNGRIDLKIIMAKRNHWIELKQWLIGDQKGTSYGPSDYFGDTKMGIVRDIDKLKNIPGGDVGWLLILNWRNPGDHAWSKGIQTFHRTYSPRRVVTRSHPSDYPQTYFLGLLEVKQESKV